MPNLKPYFYSTFEAKFKVRNVNIMLNISSLFHYIYFTGLSAILYLRRSGPLEGHSVDAIFTL